MLSCSVNGTTEAEGRKQGREGARKKGWVAREGFPALSLTSGCKTKASSSLASPSGKDFAVASLPSPDIGLPWPQCRQRSTALGCRCRRELRGDDPSSDSPVGCVCVPKGQGSWWDFLKAPQHQQNQQQTGGTEMLGCLAIRPRRRRVLGSLEVGTCLQYSAC